ncbi:HDOD domain-containing protein [Aliiglaciecola sp. CAU 1673]|uniref:HDOD domain-containing protein n=1 Tax=Aliiglaciecola sp. CAU 1673 TaxID=3032595 RepID=UPI0023DB0B7C|nr:HDOD domain-containing protein [Aliiglaciecola sp. CAU 1673]MDF2180058.1 HDOD domain-containing protein [Aliiglaciecola sp. CAU 1673]
MSTENALLTILVERINNDTLVLPTLPAIALKVRRASDDPDTNLNHMADVISMDPALSARMIKIANSAYMGRTVKVDSLVQAVTRIGLRQVKNVATALAMEQLFVSKNEIVRTHLNQVWDQTVEVVATSMALLQSYHQKTKNRRLNLDSMTLAALVHNIGVLPIFTEAERHDDVFANPTFLQVAVQKLSGRIGSIILREWEFNDEMVKVAESWRNLQYLTPELSYVDFIRAAVAACDGAGSLKDAIMNLSVQRGVFEDINLLKSEEFAELKDSAKQIFA